MKLAEPARNHSLYAVLYVAQEDLRQAAFFAAHLVKKGWHFQPWERRGSTYMQQSAFTTALVTAYSRPFTSVRRRSKIPKKLMPYDQKQWLLHGVILALRNEVYAHSDVNLREIRPFKINGQPSAVERLPSMRLTKEQAETLRIMIAVASAAIGRRLAELLRQIDPVGVEF